MTLTQINYIIALDRCRNFAQAAKECFVTQPTLSTQVQKLEDYLQIIIFDRNKFPIEPTPLGEKVIEYARSIQNSSNALEELSKNLRGEIKGEFIISIIPTLAPYVLPLFLKSFTTKYPEVSLRIQEATTSQSIELLESGIIDAAILATPLHVKNFTESILFQEPFKILFSKDHPLLVKEKIKEEDLCLDESWLLKEGHCLRLQALQLCSQKRNPEHSHVSFEAGSLETIINLVSTTTGFTVLPFLSTMNLRAAEASRLREFEGLLPARTISLVTGPYSVKKSLEEALRKTIISSIPTELKDAAKNIQVIDPVK